MQPFPFSLVPTSDDEQFMLEALKEAWKAFCLEEVPVGAVIVHKGKVIARGKNEVEMLQDATAHAEMLCMTVAETALENWRLLDTTLYCTMEPCAMCAGAMQLCRVPTLVYGAPDIRHGANGSLVHLLSGPHPTHQIEVRKGVYAEQAGQLLRDFFSARRKGQ